MNYIADTQRRNNPAMTKGHYEMIARVVKATGGKDQLTLAKAFADELRGTNEAFNRDRFISACID